MEYWCKVAQWSLRVTRVIMARRGIPMIAFPRVRTIIIYIYVSMFVSLTRVWALSINGHGAKKSTRSSSTEESCVTYVETGTNSIFDDNIIEKTTN